MRNASAAMLVLALAAAGCGSSASSSSSTPATTTTTTTATSSAGQVEGNRLATRRVSGIGAVLVSGHGRTLYVFLPEKGGKLKCAGACASVWPPLLHGHGKPESTSAVHPNLVGTIANPAGAGSIITYAGWPLHVYSLDTGSGSFRGQGKGGQWYMISPSGTVITKPVNTGSGGSVY